MDRDNIKAGSHLLHLDCHDATCTEVVIVGYTDHMRKLIVRAVGTETFGECYPVSLHENFASVRRSIEDSIEGHRAKIRKLLALAAHLPPPGEEDEDTGEYGGEGGDAVAPTPVVECVGVMP